MALGFVIVVGAALLLKTPGEPSQDLGVVEVNVDRSTGAAPGASSDEPVEILDPDVSSSPLVVGEAGPCRYLDPVTVNIEHKPLGVSLGPAIVAGLWEDFEVGPLVVVESSLVRLYPPPAFVVAAVVLRDGKELGIGAWISRERVALFRPGPRHRAGGLPDRAVGLPAGHHRPRRERHRSPSLDLRPGRVDHRSRRTSRSVRTLDRRSLISQPSRSGCGCRQERRA